MPRIRLLDVKPQKTPGFYHDEIAKAKKEGTILETLGEEEHNGYPCWRVKVGTYYYIWYVYKEETELAKKQTVIITE